MPRRVNSGVASSFLYPFPRRPPRHFLYLRSQPPPPPFFHVFALSPSHSRSRSFPPTLATLGCLSGGQIGFDNCESRKAETTVTSLIGQPAGNGGGWKWSGNVSVFRSTSRWSITVARSLTPRVQREKKSISWILLSIPCARPRQSVRIHSSELITAPAARRIVITLPTLCAPSRLSFFFFLFFSLPSLTRGPVTHYLDIVLSAVRSKELFDFFSPGCWNIRFVVKSKTV